MFGRMGSEEEFRAPGGTDINIFSYFTVQFSFLPKFYKSCFLHLFVLIMELSLFRKDLPALLKPLFIASMYQPDTKHFFVSGYHNCLFQPICPRRPGCYRTCFMQGSHQAADC